MRAKAALTTIFILTVLLTLAWQIGTAKGRVVTDGLVSYWTFDKADIEGDTAKDVWGENDGTIMGDPQRVDGKVGKALEFNGVDDAIEVPDNETLAFSDSFTFEAWTKINAFVTNAAIVTKGTWAGFIALEHGDAGNQEFKIRIKSGGNAQQMYPGYKTGVWYHAVMVVDGRGPGAFRLYIDGKLVEPALDNGGVGNLTSPDESLWIGFEQRNGIFYDGVIDEVRIYNRGLSVDEIQRNYRAKGLSVVASTVKLALTWGAIKASR